MSEYKQLKYYYGKELAKLLSDKIKPLYPDFKYRKFIKMNELIITTMKKMNFDPRNFDHFDYFLIIKISINKKLLSPDTKILLYFFFKL